VTPAYEEAFPLLSYRFGGTFIPRVAGPEEGAACRGGRHYKGRSFGMPYSTRGAAGVPF